jgi:predicted MFS family arabinose efflux permease
MCYGYLALMTWFICQSGFTLALLAKEKPHKVEVQPKAWSREMLKAAWEDKAWLRFLCVISLLGALFGNFVAFVDVYAYKVLHVNVANAAGFQMIGLLVRIAAAGAGGFIVDKFGARRIMPYWIVGQVVTMLIILLFPNIYGAYATLMWSQLWWCIVGTAMTVIFYSLPKPEHRTGQFAIQLMMVYVSSALGPIWAGYCCDKFGYVHSFMGMAVGVVLSTPLLLWSLAPMAKSDRKQGAA